MFSLLIVKCVQKEQSLPWRPSRHAVPQARDFRDTKKAHKMIFVPFQFCVLFGSGPGLPKALASLSGLCFCHPFGTIRSLILRLYDYSQRLLSQA
jgi:hypothetical protein